MWRVFARAAHDHELAELRNEARADKDKAAEELTKEKLTREKLEGLTQGLAQTDQVIKAAQAEISQLKIQNDELRRRAAMQEGGKPAADFGKIEGTNKQPKTEGLEQGREAMIDAGLRDKLKGLASFMCGNGDIQHRLVALDRFEN
ncbi:MAG: hypothetical protein JO232_22425 [Verrucomicrobia bacterium]|nr:hypothetical protein [Verrucomicrobiota bacterium]